MHERDTSAREARPTAKEARGNERPGTSSACKPNSRKKSRQDRRREPPISAQSDEFILSRVQGVWLETGKRERFPKQPLEELRPLGCT